MQNELIPVPQPLSVAEPALTPQPLTADPPNGTPAARADLESLLNPAPTLCLERVTPAPPAIVITAAASVPLPQNKARRRGRIARLPKIQRDMVNRMLANGVPYKNIVAALAESGIKVLERNISRWATGGYQEWRFQNDLVLENSLAQDHLVDYLRRDDASELSEVGLQAAATRLSQIFLQKAARAENVEANLGTFSQLVDILSRLNREIGLLQKQRDDSRRTLGSAHDAARIKNEEQKSTLEIERDFSDPEDPDCGLDKPPVPPLLPPYPTTTNLKIKNLQEKIRKAREHRESVRAFMDGLRGKPFTASSSPEITGTK